VGHQQTKCVISHRNKL